MWLPGGVVNDRPLFTSPEQEWLVIAVVQDNPRGKDEGFFAYLERIAIAAGLMKADAPRGPMRMVGVEPAEEVKA